jgi:hypothetical protein
VDWNTTSKKHTEKGRLGFREYRRLLEWNQKQSLRKRQLRSSQQCWALIRDSLFWDFSLVYAVSTPASPSLASFVPEKSSERLFATNVSLISHPMNAVA